MHDRAERAIEAFRAAHAAQPAPAVVDGPPVWGRVLDSLVALRRDPEVSADTIRVFEALAVDRSDLGFRRYRTLLRANNGRNFLVDYIEERLDGVAYLRGHLMQETARHGIAPPELVARYRSELRLTAQAVDLWLAHVDAAVGA